MIEFCTKNRDFHKRKLSKLFISIREIFLMIIQKGMHFDETISPKIKIKPFPAFWHP